MRVVCVKYNKHLRRFDHYGLHRSCFLRWFNLSKVCEFKDLDAKKVESSSKQWDIEKKKDTFYHGRYLKYSAHLNHVDYILKVQEKKYPDLPGMEYICNCIASLLSLEVPKYYLIIFNKRLNFVTYNFMQDYQKSTLHHIYKFVPHGDKNHNCQMLLNL